MNDDDQLQRLSRELQAIIGSKRYDHIKDVASRILALNPRDPFALSCLAEAQYHHACQTSDDEEFSRMHQTLSRALALYPEEAHFYYQLYLYYLWYGGAQYIQARDCLLAAIRLQPQSAMLYRALGEIYLINREADKAVEHLGKAVELSPPEAEYRSRLALALLRQHKVSQSLEVAERALSDAPDDMKVLDTVGMIYILLGDLDKADRFFREAIRRDPTYNYFHQHQDWIKRELRDRQKQEAQGRKYTPLYIRQKQTKRFFDEDGETTVAL